MAGLNKLCSCLFISANRQMTHSVLSPFILIISSAGKTNTLLPQNLSAYAYKKMSNVTVRSNQDKRR